MNSSFGNSQSKPGDCQTIIKWANMEGANKGLYDHLAFQRYHKLSFLVGQIDGERVSSICVAEYNEDFATIGLYYVKPSHRLKGNGHQICKKAMQHTSAKNIGIQGSLKQEKNYQMFGFKRHHKTIRFFTLDTNRSYKSSYLIPCKNVDFEKLNEFDQKNFPAPRKQFLAQWITLPYSHAIAFVRNEIIQGYGVVRISDQGYKIGPLFADSFQVAEQIFKNLIGFVPPMTKTTLDVPQINEQGMKLQEKFKMTREFQCVSMYTNGLPMNSYFKTVYGVTCLEFG